MLGISTATICTSVFPKSCRVRYLVCYRRYGGSSPHYSLLRNSSSPPSTSPSCFSIYVSSSIQKNGFKRGSIDYFYFNLLCFAIIYVIAFTFGISSLTGIYLYSLFYYFGRVHSDRLIIINFIPVRAPYCLWFLLAIEWLTGDASLYNDLLGLFVGHCLYFMFNVYHRLGMCRQQDKKFFDTPQAFINLVSPLFNAQNRARAQVGEFDVFE